jgi:tetratricopeptide (TPR) repeat protein
MNSKYRGRAYYSFCACLFGFSLSALAADPASAHLDQTLKAGKWNAAAEAAHEILVRRPSDIGVRLQGAYALFQKGYPNAALAMLRPISKESWKSIPKEHLKLAELLALYQKKVPLTILSTRLEHMDAGNASPTLRDEIRFNQGRALFEEKKTAQAEAILKQIVKGSRYYAPASYLLATGAASLKKYKEAEAYFNRVFETTVLDQSTEFWKDLGAQDIQKLNSALKVSFDTDLLNQGKRVGELAVLGMARIAYAQRDFSTALANYDRIPPNSPFYAKARLEKLWTWLSLDRHDQAANAAQELTADEAHFESIEARPIRALILADAKKTKEAREEIQRFFDTFKGFKESVAQYRRFPEAKNLPPSLLTDLKEDSRIEDLKDYQERLQKEIALLKTEEKVLYPVFGSYATELDPLVSQTKNLIAKLTESHIDRRFKNFEALFIQAKLISAETFLEDREQLRASFLGKASTEAEQNLHDQQLVDLLTTAVKEVDEAMTSVRVRSLQLEFRQSELLWELSSAVAILSQVTKNEKDKAASEAYRRRSLQIAQDITKNHPEFPRHAQAMFFTAFALMETEHEKDAYALFEQYVKKYPEHEQVPNAYRILADAAFEKNRFKEAEELYRKILNFPNTPIAGYAFYKIGWSNYNQKNYAKALLGLEQAILWTKSLENTDQLLNLKREAHRDLISIYAEIGSHKKAPEYFERFLGGDTASWLAKLAEQLEQNGQFDKAIDLYDRLLAMNPVTEDRIRFQTAIIRGSYQLQKWDLSLKATRDLIQDFVSILEPVQDPNSPAGKAEKIVNETVLAQHFEYQNNATPKDVERILEIDRLYLKAFHLWPGSQQPLYQHAHFQLRYNQFEPASDSFISHWEQFKSTIKEPLREESVRNLVHSLEKVEEATKEAAGPTSKAAESIYKYADEYAQNYPRTKYTRPIQFLKATTFFKYQRMEEGIQASQDIFLADPADDFGARAFKNLKVAYYRVKDWKKAFEWSSALSNNPKIAATPYLADLRKIREETLFLWAENTKDNVESAKLYLQISEDPLMQNLRAEALHNAFLRYKDADLRIDALATAMKLEAASPGFKALPAIAGIRASLYQDAGDYEKALPMYAKFLSAPPKEMDPKVMNQTVLTTALLAEASGNHPDATKLYRQYLTMTANEKNASGTEEAQEGILRIQRMTQRKPASVPPYAEFDTLMKLEKDLAANPLVKTENLAQAIQGGAQRLEKTIRKFLEVSSDVRTPSYYAFETYCTIPYLYGHYQSGVRKLGDGQPEELKMELEKIASPLDAQSFELANKCLERAMEAKHDGPKFRKVLGQWGWAKNEAAKQAVGEITGLLGGNAPWVAAAPLADDEKTILQNHLQKKESADSWYTLAKLRFDRNQIGLSRLTFISTLSREPESPRVLNNLAVIEQMSGLDRNSAVPLFQKAAELGSGQAAANLALIHLGGARLKDGLEQLKAAQEKKVFEKHTDITAAITKLELALNAPPEPVVKADATPNATGAAQQSEQPIPQESK